MQRESNLGRSLLFVGFTVLLSADSGRCERIPTTSAPPNIVYIMADDLGYGDVGCYGQRRIKTPALDRMAAQGLRFTDHYAGNTVCAPSRCVLMTGMHPGHSFVRGNKEVKPMGQWPLPKGTVTVARLVQDAGYRTGLVGKWGLGGPDSSGIPNKQGFDYFFGYLCQRHAHNYYPEFLFENTTRVRLAKNRLAGPRDKGFYGEVVGFIQRMVTENGTGKPRADGAGVAIERGQYSHDLCARKALEFIERNRSRPFFLYLSLTIPHANNEGGKFGMEVPSLGSYAHTNWPEPQKAHAAMVTRMDLDIGRLLAKIKSLGLDENTLVLFTSDNGPHREGGNDPDFNNSNGPLRGIKRELYDGGIRVPLIARWPGRIAAGTTTAHPSAFWDFLPTMCELTGVQTPSNVDGISYLPTLLGQDDQRSHEYLYWEFQTQRAARLGPWKAVQRNRFAPIELYNLSTDLGETTNVASQHAAVMARVLKVFETAHVESELFPTPWAN